MREIWVVEHRDGELERDHWYLWETFREKRGADMFVSNADQNYWRVVRYIPAPGEPE